MKTVATKLTPAQEKTFAEENAALMEAAAKQLDEHKLWLIVSLRALDPASVGLSSEAMQRLIADVPLIELEYVQVDVNRRLTVSRKYPDALGAFLSREDLPSPLGFKDHGGRPVEAKDAARRLP